MEVSGPIRRSVAKQTEEGRQARNTACRELDLEGQKVAVRNRGIKILKQTLTKYGQQQCWSSQLELAR